MSNDDKPSLLNMKTTIIGIDPGSSGGIAWCLNGEVYAVPMPDTEGDIIAHLRMILTQSDGLQIACYIEDIPKFIASSEAAQFSVAVMFQNFGFLLGVLQTLGIPTYKVVAQRWQGSLNIGKKERIRAQKDATAEEKKGVKAFNAKAKRDWKTKLRSEAQRRYPKLHITLDTSDACLIMDYGIRQSGMPTTAPEPALCCGDVPETAPMKKVTL